MAMDYDAIMKSVLYGIRRTVCKKSVGIGGGTVRIPNDAIDYEYSNGFYIITLDEKKVIIESTYRSEPVAIWVIGGGERYRTSKGNLPLLYVNFEKDYAKTRNTGVKFGVRMSFIKVNFASVLDLPLLVNRSTIAATIRVETGKPVSGRV